MNEPKPSNRLSVFPILKRWLLPNVMDARVFSVVLFWLAMMVASASSSVGIPRADTVDLWFPWWAGLAGIASALLLVRTVGRPSRRTWNYGIVTAVVSLVLYFAAAWLMGIDEPTPETAGASSAGWLARNGLQRLMTSGWVWGSIAAMVGLGVQSAFANRTGSASLGTRTALLNRMGLVRPFIVKHRVGVMTGFVGVMMPLIVLRNIFDPDSNSTLYFVTPAVAFFVIVGGIVFVPGVARLAAKTGWTHWGVLVFVAAVVGLSLMSWNSFARGLSRGKFELGSHFAFPVFTMMFLGTLLAGLMDRPTGDTGERRAKVSLLSPIVVLAVVCGLCFGELFFDSRVVAISFGQAPREFWEGKWAVTANRSRRLMRLTGGGARLLPDRYQPKTEVRIRDERDADVIDRVCNWPARQINHIEIVVRDVQPFVNLDQLANGFKKARFVGGELGDDQMRSVTGGLSQMTVESVLLPSDLGNGLNVSNLSIHSDTEMPGFAEFFENCVQKGTRSITLKAPLTPSDWAVVVRNSGESTYIRANLDYLPNQALCSPAIKPTTDLTMLLISQNGVEQRNRRHNLRRLELAIRNGAPLTGTDVDGSKQWDVVVAAPEAWPPIPSIPRSDREVSTFTNDCRWAYGWDEDGKITHLWMPGLMLTANELAGLTSLKCLRLDSRGFMEPIKPMSTPLSGIDRLGGLEQLYLADFPNDSLSFLWGLDELRHLQIRAPESLTGVKGSFAVCKNLETLRLFGAPIAATISELATLKRLRRLEVIDDRAELLKPASVAKLRASLPGIEVVVTPTANYDPELSEEFVRHRQNVRRELLEWIDAEIAKETSR